MVLIGRICLKINISYFVIISFNSMPADLGVRWSNDTATRNRMLVTITTWNFRSGVLVHVDDRRKRIRGTYFRTHQLLAYTSGTIAKLNGGWYTKISRLLPKLQYPLPPLFFFFFGFRLATMKYVFDSTTNKNTNLNRTTSYTNKHNE